MPGAHDTDPSPEFVSPASAILSETDPPPEINFDQGLPDPALFPVADIERYLVEVLETDGHDALRYFGAEGGFEEMRFGYIGLRRGLADRIRRRDGRDLGTRGVALVHGSMNGISLTARAYLAPGDAAIVEEATYGYAVEFMRSNGAKVFRLPMDDEGMVVDALEDCLAAIRAEGLRPRLLYSIPTHHSPTGTVLPLERRRRLVEIAQVANLMILEDNCYYEFAYGDPPPPTLLALDGSGVVIQSDSFSKYVAPGLRMAWVAGSEEAIARLVAVRQDFAVSQLVARALARYLEDGVFDTHLVELRAAYQRKRDLTVSALERYCAPYVSFQVPTGGFYLWIKMSDEIDWEEAVRRAAAKGVGMRSGSRFMEGDEARPYLRIAPPQVAEADIERGIAIFGEALAASRRS